MVTDDAALDAVTSGSDGILAGLQDRKVYVDMSTVSPRASRAVAEQVKSLGAQMLDAPVSGSIPQAESGTLAIMVGGDEQAFDKVEPLLRGLGQTVTHIGETSASPRKPSRSAKACCWPSATASIRASRPR
jgi:3-hydroxyisobutyrate dehydrogenase-like beta-hydroxyacid dehydrogenase